MCRICDGTGEIYLYSIYEETETTARPSKDIYIICYHCEGTGKEPWFTDKRHKIIEK